MSEREVRYCTTEDGVRIAYCAEGTGPTLLLGPVMVESFSRHHLVPAYGEFIEALKTNFRLIRFDMRGTGLSQREATDYSTEALIGEVDAVLASERVDRTAILGFAGFGLRAIAYSARRPENVDRLVLGWTAGRFTDVAPRSVWASLITLMEADWRLGARAVADLGTRNFVASSAHLEDMYAESTDARHARRYLEDGLEWQDCNPSLSQIRCPTMVLHRTGDQIFTESITRGLAASIPDCRHVLLPEDCAIFSENWPPMYQAILEFLGGQLPSLRNETTLRTVLFTDLVGHTEMMSRLGDERGRDVLRDHERITREVLASHGGTEVKTMGDGFMASFGSVTKAVECAIALQSAFAERAGEPLNVRVGINAGEPIEEDGDLFGATVILASRIAAKAGGGEILVADTVRGLCSGKGFLFADRGEFVAKGFEEPVRVYEVRWRE